MPTSLNDAAISLTSLQAKTPATKPIIGIVPTYKYEEETLHMPERYVKAVVAAGGAPIVLPFTPDVSVYETLFPSIDGFLLSGGQDISPVRYGEDITYGKLTELTPNREEVEYLILSFAKQFDVPVLGICRGMQIINVSFGGTLYQDLAEQLPESTTPTHWQEVDYHTPTHTVHLEPSSKLFNILGMTDIKVNSMHHQGIRELAPGLTASAYDPEGLIEAIEAPEMTFMVGVQWHPEFFAAGGSMDALFESLVREAESTRCRGARCGACLRILKEECGGCWPSIRFEDIQ